jgi:hypothetical protein
LLFARGKGRQGGNRYGLADLQATVPGTDQAPCEETKEAGDGHDDE